MSEDRSGRPRRRIVHGLDSNSAPARMAESVNQTLRRETRRQRDILTRRTRRRPDGPVPRRGPAGLHPTRAKAQGRALHVCVASCREQSRGEEVVQEAFAPDRPACGEFRQDSRFSTWIYRITRNLCVDELRKHALRRHPSLDEPSRAGDARTGEPRRTHGRLPVQRRARCHVGGDSPTRGRGPSLQLPDEQREVFLLRELSSLPFKEIATIVGVQENTVKSRLRYALERLQEALCEFEEYARALR